MNENRRYIAEHNGPDRQARVAAFFAEVELDTKPPMCGWAEPCEVCTERERTCYCEPDPPLCPHGILGDHCGWCEATECHCGAPLAYGYDGNPLAHRGMCEHCDSVRCDAYPGECGR